MVAYCTFMSVRLITFDKQPVIFPVVVRETWRRLFAVCVLKVIGPKATNVCQYDQLCVGLKAIIDGSYMAFKLFEMLTCPQKIGDFYLSAQKMCST